MAKLIRELVINNSTLTIRLTYDKLERVGSSLEVCTHTTHPPGVHVPLTITSQFTINTFGQEQQQQHLGSLCKVIDKNLSPLTAL